MVVASIHIYSRYRKQLSSQTQYTRNTWPSLEEAFHVSKKYILDLGISQALAGLLDDLSQLDSPQIHHPGYQGYKGR